MRRTVPTAVALMLLLAAPAAMAAWPLHDAAKKGDVAKVRRLIEQGKGLDEVDLWGKTPLHDAAALGHVEIIGLLIDAGFDVDVPLDSYSEQGRLQHRKARRNMSKPGLQGATPLYHSASAGKLEAARYLIERGASLDAPTRTGTTPLIIALQQQHLDVAAVLIEAGADVHAEMEGGMTALTSAAWKNQPAIVELLVSRDVDLEAQDAGGNTALILAAGHGHEPMVRFLVESGADLEMRAAGGETALFRAVYFGHQQIVSFLQQAGADIHASAEADRNCLHGAMLGGQSAIARRLLEWGAEPVAVGGSQDDLYATAGVFEIAAGHRLGQGDTETAQAHYRVAAEAYEDAAAVFRRSAAEVKGQIRRQRVRSVLFDGLAGAAGGTLTRTGDNYVLSRHSPLKEQRRVLTETAERCDGRARQCRTAADCLEQLPADGDPAGCAIPD